MAREILIALRVNEDEKNKVKRLADAQGMTISAYLRRCINMPKQPTKRAA